MANKLIALYQYKSASCYSVSDTLNTLICNRDVNVSRVTQD